jgi:hypothetical protein
MVNLDTRPSPQPKATAAWPGRTVTTALLVRLLGALIVLVLTSHHATAGSPKTRRVLLLYAEEKDLPMNRIVDAQLRATFRDKLGDGVEL